jgi:hypothetical protein
MRAKLYINTIIIIALLLAAVGCGKSGGGFQTDAFKPYITCGMMFNVAVNGCEGFKNVRGAWPGSLDDINSFIGDLVHKDAWGHPLGFTPYDDAKGYGEIISYGKDGKPGGTGDDADLVVRFPLKSNADWNQKLAAGIKFPPQFQSNWYEFYFR